MSTFITPDRLANSGLEGIIMNMGGYNGSSGDHLLAWLFLLYFLIGPYWLLWLEVRAFRRSEAQSGMALFMLIILGVLAIYMGSDERHAFPFIRGFSGFQFQLTRIVAVIFPIAIGWEAYKHGWMTMLQEKMKSKKKRRKKKLG